MTFKSTCAACSDQSANIVRFFPSLLTREYAKRNERVIGDDGKFTHSLHHSDVNFLANSADQRVKLSWERNDRSPKKGIF